MNLYSINKIVLFCLIGLLLISGAYYSVHDPLKPREIGQTEAGSASEQMDLLVKQESDSLRAVFDTIDNQILVAELYDSADMRGKNVLITCGGYKAELGWVSAWTQALYYKRLKDYNIGLICIIKGPRDEYYDSREIDIKTLTSRIVSAYQQYDLNETIIIAHSSGVFPVHQMFDLLYSGGKEGMALSKKGVKSANYDSRGITKNRISYIMLDGELGIPKGYALTADMVKHLKRVYSVYAIDDKTGTRSGLYHEAIKVKQRYPDMTTDYIVRSQNSGCNKGAKWCVHQTVITTKPHNPAGYDLERDYQFFGDGREVVDEFMDRVEISMTRK